MNEDGALEGRVAIVTGAAGGLGQAITRRLIAHGASTAALDLLLPSAVKGEDSESISWFQCDVADPMSVAQTVHAVVTQFGAVDILVNNAGLLSGRSSLLGANADELHRFFAVNAVGPLLLVQNCFPHLRDSAHRGRVINVASRTFFTGGPGQIAYVASKGALIGMTRVMARELGEFGITVNAVMPAQVATPGTLAHSSEEVFARTMSGQAIQEFVTPDDFAGLVAFLATADARMITGQCLVCDGGGLLR